MAPCTRAYLGVPQIMTFGCGASAVADFALFAAARRPIGVIRRRHFAAIGRVFGKVRSITFGCLFARVVLPQIRWAGFGRGNRSAMASASAHCGRTHSFMARSPC